MMLTLCSLKILSQTNLLVTGVLTTAQGPLIDATAPAYGAVHDGIHDDTAAIQLAVNFAATAGGTVYLPCGEYLMSGNTGVIVHSPKVNIKGQNQSCVILRYTGTGRALTVQMNPFTTTPAGKFAGFTVLGTSAASEGILSGQIVSSHWHDITVSGFTSKTANAGLGGAGLHLHNAGNLTSWTERNVFENVSLGGISGNAYNTEDLLMDSDNAADSFGYNRFST
ncbi:MAG TPA: glycosyl hydrolase family 28-related protein [Terriglobales bacterium]|nr:glycosyl hydrolase family 28-related protein [Terriglobales bacterium]